MYQIKHIEIETTNRCQLNCISCPRPQMVRRVGDMTDETFDRLMAQIEPLQIESCYMHMFGDPLLDNKIVKRIKEAKKYIKHVAMSTNAVALYSNIASEIFQSGLDHLIISFDGVTKNTYEKIRCGAKYGPVMHQIERALAIRQEQHTDSNTRVTLQMVKQVGNKYEMDLNVSAPGLGPWFQIEKKDYSTFAGNVVDMSISGTPEKRHKCNKIENSVGIHWNGDIVICCRVFNSPDPYLGNVNEDNLIDVFNGDMYTLMRKERLKKRFNNTLKFCGRC